MTHWNYRICKETFSKGKEFEEINFSIRETYYNEDGDIFAVTEQATGASGENFDEIKQALDWMQLALNRDVVDLDTIIFAKRNKDDADLV